MTYFFHCDAFQPFFILVLFLFGASGFNPFMDNELHKIEWVDQSTWEKEDTVVCTFRSYKIGGSL